jgi:hypothetical protein
LAGCSTGARYVTTTNSAGVVAIPSNTDDWPYHYRKQAEELMQAKCPGGYVIEREETCVECNKEWRIYFRRSDADTGASLALAVKPATAAQPWNLRQPIALTPVVTPVQMTATPQTFAPNILSNRPGGIPPSGN